MRENNKDQFRILFVCTGNTCRSPMAEGILKKMLKDNGIETVQVSSAGIYSLENVPASPFAIQAARLRNVDLSSHRSRQLSQKLVEETDLLLVMSQEHIEYIKRADPKAQDKTYLLKVFPQLPPRSNEDQDPGVLFIKDPIGCSLEDYDCSFLEIKKEIKRIFPEILNLMTKR